ncbi:MAG: hypothetical protein GX931_06555 [Acholeplasmataceae bacterium]|jgi:hypothetical protein|nr:hypothetical protein [Acholeplasmataceae bacterium]
MKIHELIADLKKIISKIKEVNYFAKVELQSKLFRIAKTIVEEKGGVFYSFGNSNNIYCDTHLSDIVKKINEVFVQINNASKEYGDIKTILSEEVILNVESLIKEINDYLHKK